MSITKTLLKEKKTNDYYTDVAECSYENDNFFLEKNKMPNLKDFVSLDSFEENKEKIVSNNRDNIFFCNNIKYYGLRNSEKYLSSKWLDNILEIKKNKSFSRKSLIKDITLLKKLGIFKKIDIYVIKHENSSYSLYYNFKHNKCKKIKRISFVCSRIIPNLLKETITSYFLGKDANISNIANIAKSIDSWYLSWYYGGCSVDEVNGVEEGDLRIVVREAFIDSFNILLYNDHEEDNGNKYYELDTINELLVKPIRGAFNSIIKFKIGQPHNSFIDNELLDKIYELDLFETFIIAEEIISEEDNPGRVLREDNPLLLDYHLILILKCLNDQAIELMVDIPNVNFEIFKYLGYSPFGAGFVFEWDLTQLKDKIKMLNIYYEKETAILSNIYDSVDFYCEFIVPYYNYGDESNPLSLKLLLMVEDGTLDKDYYSYNVDYLFDYFYAPTLDIDEYTTYYDYNYMEDGYQESIDSNSEADVESIQQKLNTSKIHNDYKYYADHNYDNYSLKEEINYDDDINDDLEDEEFEDELLYDYYDSEEPYDTYIIGLKVILEEEMTIDSFFTINYVANFLVLEDSDDILNSASQNYRSYFNDFKDPMPLVLASHNVESKIFVQTNYETNHIYIENYFNKTGSRLLLLSEFGLNFNGIFNKILFEFKNYKSLFNLYKGNERFMIQLVNFFRVGMSFGVLNYYDYFLLGGGKSIRGYYTGEIGISKNIFESSLEFRLVTEKNIDSIFMFFDYCSDLNSSKNIVYNPSDYHSLNCQGSSFGVGLFIGNARIELGLNTSTNKRFINFDYGEKF
uniref:Outer plastid envelop protein 75 n=1 Tax=Amorphochlora amoebiformis TaxID=1561963 RepID=A0A0H5BLU4_9EUKA|nr:outer plastid envelop protein 75 [Amorphochlora amoebiformis]